MDPKAGAQEQINAIQAELLKLSHRIHAHPELGFEEERACTWLAESLTDAGFSVETGVFDLPTSFVAKAGNGPLHLAICAEYDCLPGVGHACGHNLIAAMALGAGIAAARVADEVGLTVQVIGTPAEEGGGGKIMLLDRGAFAGVHAAMMTHPAPSDSIMPKIIASSRFNVHYRGKAAHAAAYPELGINAADAMTIAQTAIGLLRQHIRSTDRIHGIITKGGDAPNIIPAHTSAQYSVRGRTVAALEELRPRVYRCFEAGALATGGYGTALGVMRTAKAQGKNFRVIADETRPYLQGSRLTAWELQREGFDVTIIPDAAAAFLMRRGEIDSIIVGADRIAANGDVANKIGTYGLALTAHAHGVPFYVAAPTSTIDLETATGDSLCGTLEVGPILAR